MLYVHIALLSFVEAEKKGAPSQLSCSPSVDWEAAENWGTQAAVEEAVLSGETMEVNFSTFPMTETDLTTKCQDDNSIIKQSRLYTVTTASLSVPSMCVAYWFCTSMHNYSLVTDKVSEYLGSLTLLFDRCVKLKSDGFSNSNSFEEE